MNTYTLLLCANTTSEVKYFYNIDLYDITYFSISLSAISESIPLKRIEIDWGDGDSSLFINRFTKAYREDSIFAELLYGKFSSIFAEDISHQYRPSQSSMYALLSCQILIEYIDGNHNKFIAPITLKSHEFHDSIGELYVLNTNLLPLTSNNVKMTFATQAGNQIIESTTQ